MVPPASAVICPRCDLQGVHFTHEQCLIALRAAVAAATVTAKIKKGGM